MTQSLDTFPTHREAPPIEEVTASQVGYHEIDAHVDYVASEAELYRDLDKPDHALAIDLADRALLLANHLPALQAESLAVDVAASTQHSHAIETAYAVIDKVYEGRSEDQKTRALKLARDTIRLAIEGGMTPNAAGIQALVDDATERGVNFDATLTSTIDPAIRDQEIARVAHEVIAARKRDLIAHSPNAEVVNNDTVASGGRADMALFLEDD